MEDLLRFIIENWEVLSGITLGTGALGVGSAKGIKAYEKYKDKSQDERIEVNKSEIEKNRRHIEKLIEDMIELKSALAKNTIEDKQYMKLVMETNNLVGTVISELKEFKEKYYEDRIKDKEKEIEIILSKKK